MENQFSQIKTPLLQRNIALFGNFLRDYAVWIRRAQWGIVASYLVLLFVPLWLPLPDDTAVFVNNLTLFAQFVFWGVWWPFVILSMLVAGRSWCGLLCPEGMLSEWASQHGRGKPVPAWIRWEGWPTLVFFFTTLYGQIASVDQYPDTMLIALGTPTLAAILVGIHYGKGRRVWCRYLCPVGGLFSTLARLSPLHYRVDKEKWQHSPRVRHAVHCAPMLPLGSMQSAGKCVMCGRCSEYRGAIMLATRTSEYEVLHVAEGSQWESRLILFGLIGLGCSAFLWTTSPWWIALKQSLAGWLIDHQILWPLQDTAPWWLLTHYPQVNDSLNWLDGGVILFFMLACSFLLGGAFWLMLRLADYLLPARTPVTFHKLAQAMLPVAACGLFLGLSATTLSFMQQLDIETGWANTVRMILLALATLWSLRLVWRIAALRSPQWQHRVRAVACALPPLAANATLWILLFFVW